MPAVGQVAPAFALRAHTSVEVALSDLKGKRVVLYFYPKDATPGCTVEAQEFRDRQAAFEAANTVVIGVSPDSVASHCRFVEKQGLNFLLLADTEQAAARAYGVWGEKSMYGRKYMGVRRATFLIDEDGAIAAVWPKAQAKGHAAEVLETLARI
ncbi:MAG: thioredoxin-dependent thiol peroxidase [Candidatus Hydrogenedentes bacterium]|nr:thioredoxin-dependent thiol peroxidase [Candidatus Hydrogenedentota bacterium]